MKSRKALLQTDGASLGNPGPSGIGVVLKVGEHTYELSEHIGTATNNIAEYSALIRGLEKALEAGAAEISIRLDSELVVRQINGQYRVKDEKLKPLYLKAMGLLRSFDKFSIAHVRREENTEADALSKKAAGRS